MEKESSLSPTTVKSLYFLWDLWCIVSVVGIWPRYIEPRLLQTTKVDIFLPNLPESFDGVRLVQLSDLHLSPEMDSRFLKKIQQRVAALNPDLLVFTGDFLCYSRWQQQSRMARFLSGFQAPLGCYASLGNHDYASYVGLGRAGEACIKKDPQPPLIAGFQMLFRRKAKTDPVPLNEELPPHPELQKLLTEQTPFRVLNNETVQVEREGSHINLTGLGDSWAGAFRPERAFEGYDKDLPGILLSHNPDTMESLETYPGDLVLCGHTHGAQINLPFFRNKFLGIRHREWARGLHRVGNKKLYVNRGLGAVFTFRWFARPEVLQVTLRRGKQAS